MKKNANKKSRYLTALISVNNQQFADLCTRAANRDMSVEDLFNDEAANAWARFSRDEMKKYRTISMPPGKLGKWYLKMFEVFAKDEGVTTESVFERAVIKGWKGLRKGGRQAMVKRVKRMIADQKTGKWQAREDARIKALQASIRNRRAFAI